MNYGRKLMLAAALLCGSAVPNLCLAGMPAGIIQITVREPTSHVWDLSKVLLLENVAFGVSDADVDVSFVAPFSQTGAGKFSGAGPTEMTISSPVYAGTIDATYKVSGGITSSRGLGRVVYNGSAQGVADVGGRQSTFSGKLLVKLTVDSINQAVFGTYTATGSATSFGKVTESVPVDVPWFLINSWMGNGDWTLTMDLANDGVKKVSGTAAVTLSSGTIYEFAVKGVYKPKTDSSILVLAPAQSSKGSTLKVVLNGGTVSSIKGKVSGHLVNLAY